ncbi:hypothetical protein PoB_001986400 [Plakobranchus ocellatus]|uniref:Secreted protein n=1 Tax=Plakobranchus ocellatus TaxID=259542 RepID=A0AAV3ZDA6_9GAST|nr:hypothetical protein PoB_001986400 [Plakobranchus ocellatus]
MWVIQWVSPVPTGMATTAHSGKFMTCVGYSVGRHRVHTHHTPDLLGLDTLLQHRQQATSIPLVRSSAPPSKLSKSPQLIIP